MPDPRQRRYPWADLEAFATGRGWSVPELAAHAGKDRSEFHLWRRQGSVPEYAADKVAVALGTTPDLIWGEAWTAVGRAVAEAEDARQRARRAATARERYRRNASVREAAKARSKAWRDANPEAKRLNDATWRRLNRDHRLAYLRTWYEQNRETELRRAKERYRLSDRGKTRVDIRCDANPNEEFFYTQSRLQGGQDPRLTSTSTSPIHTQSKGKSTSNPHGLGVGSVTDRWDNGTTEQEVA